MSAEEEQEEDEEEDEEEGEDEAAAAAAEEEEDAEIEGGGARERGGVAAAPAAAPAAGTQKTDKPLPAAPTGISSSPPDATVATGSARGTPMTTNVSAHQAKPPSNWKPATFHPSLRALCTEARAVVGNSGGGDPADLKALLAAALRGTPPPARKAKEPKALVTEVARLRKLFHAAAQSQGQATATAATSPPMPSRPTIPSPTAATKKPSALELARAKRFREREERKRKQQRERDRRAAERNAPVTVASIKKKAKRAAAERARQKAAKQLLEARKDICEVLLFMRFSGYVWTCSKRGAREYGTWHRRYLELHYRELKFLKRKGGTSKTVPKSYPILKGTKIKSMRKVIITELPGHENDFKEDVDEGDDDAPGAARAAEHPGFPSFEVLIGGSSLRHWVCVPSVAALEGWMHALREFVPSVMSILRSTRMPSKSAAELEKEQAHQAAEDARLDHLRDIIKLVFKVAKPKHSGTLMKQELISAVTRLNQHYTRMMKNGEQRPTVTTTTKKKKKRKTKKDEKEETGEENSRQTFNANIDPLVVKATMALHHDPVLRVLLEPRLWLQSLMDLDTARDGQVAFEEVLHFVRLLEARRDQRRQALLELFELIDKDSNGELDPDEMLTAVGDPDVKEMLQETPCLRGLLNPHTYKSAFAAIDKNSDGVITVEELCEFCDQSEERAQTRMHNLGLFFRLVDVDHDGTLSKEEVLNALRSNPECRTLIKDEPSLLPLLAPDTYEEVSY